MVTFTLNNEGMPPLLLQSALDESLEPYQWVNLFLEFSYLQCINGITVVGEGNPHLSDMSKETQLWHTIKSIKILIDKFPIFFVDKALEVLIEDTKPSLDSIHVPYPCIFINKYFDIGDTKIMGFFIQNMETYTYFLLRESGKSKEEALKLTNIIRESPGIDGKFPDISYTYIAVEPDRTVITVGDEEDILIATNISKHTKKIMNKVLFYSVNICNLLVSRSNLKNPLDTTKDVRVIPHYPNENKYIYSLDKKSNKYSYIRVFGDLKEYVNGYVKERRKHKQINEYLVRGHWVSGHFRVYKDERYFRGKYANVQGRVVWIERHWRLPFIKGSNQKLVKLHQKLIKLKE